MGFGGLLEFNIAETPSTLGYWLIENFDPMACVVKLQEGREMLVEADDVTHVLRIPNGETIIKKKPKNIPYPVVTAWRALFDVHLKSITATHVADKMLSQGPNTIWFKRLFLILITMCLVESCDNGYVITRIIPNFEEPDRAKDLNWGQYMKKCLVEEVVNWNKKNRKDALTEPLVFLMALYVDRVDLMDRLVRRVYPSVTGWTCTLLRQREKFEILAGGFGCGCPVDLRNANLKKVVDNTEHLLGCKLERPELAGVATDDADPISTCENGDFWSDPEIIALMDGIAKGAEKRDVLASGFRRREELRAMDFDSPPFSLGMIQDYSEVLVQRKNDEAGPAKPTEPAKGKRKEFTVVKDVDPKGKGKMKVSYEQEAQDAQSDDFVEIPSKRVTGNAASMKRSRIGCSPYTLRATKAGDGLNKVEKELCYWVMDNDELDR
ncbi:hypothetical protein CASFOL_042880 [Castilleja foliolosa]|uniref:Uncharacterized protein n=1 Tax=Castilleja foliolosa TaxID=1961234 RepID=A0ABD3B7F3_9LAMI